MSDSDTSTGDESDHTRERRTQFAERNRRLRRIEGREQRRAEEERRERYEASATNLTAARQSQIGNGSSLAPLGWRTSASQSTPTDNHGLDPVNHGFGSADLPLSTAHRNPIQNIAGPNRISPPIRRGSVGSTRRGSVGSTRRGSVGSTRRGSVGSTQRGSGPSTRRGSDESGDTIWIGDGGGNNGDQGGDCQASGSAMGSRDDNGAVGKKA